MCFPEGNRESSLSARQLVTTRTTPACDGPPVPEGASTAAEQVTLYAYDTDAGLCARVDLHGTDAQDVAIAVASGS